MVTLSMSSPDLTDAEITAVTQVLQTPILSIGPQLKAFERTFASYVGTAHAVGVNSGTSGLHLCIIAAGIKEDDLVITTPFSFIASANCILYERAIPVFVDVDPYIGNIDPALVAEAIEALTDEQRATSSDRWLPPALRRSSFVVRRPKAILPIHAFGQSADMDPILAVAHQHDLAIIEDACEAIGAEYKGLKAGTLGDNEVMRKLAEAGIPSRPYFTPIHLQPFYRERFGYQRGDFPVTEYLGDVSLALPFSGVMTEEQVDYVCQMLQLALDQACYSNRKRAPKEKS